jgi:hypothetical protein
MTDVHVVAGLTKTTQKPKRARKRKQSEPTQIKYDDAAIAQGIRLVKALKSSQMKLGELADRLQPKYGEETLKRFAKAIGLPVATLARYRSVYRKWKGIEAPGPNFAVAKALQSLPSNHIELLMNEFPNMTKRDAITFVKDWRNAHPEDQGWKVDEKRKWFDAALKHAQDSIKYELHGHLDPDLLLRALDNPEQAEDTFRAASGAFATLADAVNRARTGAPLLALPRPPMFDDPPAKPDDAL